MSRAEKLIVIGGSAGSLEVLMELLPAIAATGKAAWLIILHRNAAYESALPALLQTHTDLKVYEAEDKMILSPDTIYIAPSDYHILLEREGSVALDVSDKVNHSRPSIDVAFETAGEAWKDQALCLLLSGANSDGAAGLASSMQNGASAIIQLPEEAAVSTMPLAGIRLAPDATVLHSQGFFKAITAFIKQI